MTTEESKEDRKKRLSEADSAVKASLARLQEAMEQRMRVDQAVEGMERQFKENHYAELLKKAFKR